MKNEKMNILCEPVLGYAIPEFEIKYSVKGDPMSQRNKITSSKDTFEFMKTIFNADKIEWVEEFVILCLNRANKPIGFYKVSQDGVAGTVADPKVIFQIALLSNASGIIVAHNHPSGNLKPSQSDIDLTKRLKEAGKVLEIQVMDHLIIVPENKYFSMSDEGVI